MAIQLPSEVMGLAVGVFIYSSVCFFCSVALILLVWLHREKTSYVALLAIFTGLSSAASLAQQLHTIVLWRDIKLAQFDRQVAAVGNPELAIAGPSVAVDLVLFYIQFYSYNVESILIVCWAAELALSVFRFQPTKVFRRHGGPTAKAAAVLVPVPQISLLRTAFLQSHSVAFFVVANAIMAFGLCCSALLLIAILFRYIQTRRQFLSWHVHYVEGSGRTDQEASSHGSEPHVPYRNIYDQWLILRFTIAFIALGAFQLVTIFFEISSVANNTRASLSGHADLSVGRAKTDFLLFMPGVSASLLTFVVFGTTKTFRDYLWKKLVPRRTREMRAENAANREPSVVIRIHNQPSAAPDHMISQPYTLTSDEGDGISLHTMYMESETGKGKEEDELPLWKVSPTTQNGF